MQQGIFSTELELSGALNYASRMTKTILAQNIAALRSHLRMNQTDFAAAVGTQQANVSKWEKGVTPEGDNLSALAELAAVSEREFRDLPWKAASPAPAAPNRPKVAAKPSDHLPTKGAHDDVGAVKLRRLNLELAMGDGTDIEDWIEEQEVNFDANLFYAITASPTDRVFIGSGIGDSMTPTIGDRDDVLIDLNENELKKGDRIYAITIEGAGAVKRLMPAGNGMVEVISDNVNHAARVRILPRAMVKIIGRVVWSGRRH